MKMETQQSKIYGTQQKQFKQGRLQQYNLPQETRKISKQSNLTPKGTRKGRQSQQKEKIIKIRAEINEIETGKKKTQKRSMKLRAGSWKR